MKITSADLRKSQCSNTDINDTDNSNTERNKTDQNDIDSLSHGINHINQSAENTQKDSDDDVIEKMERYRQIIKDNIEYDIMIQNHKKDFVDELVELMPETICFPKSSYYINDRELPSELVKSRLLKLNVSHMEYVIECMKGNHTKISNIRNYLISALYNSFTTMDSYYRADYNASPLSQL